MAQRIIHQVVQVLATGCVPLFLTDGFKEYTPALLTHFGQWVQPARRRGQGPAPKPRWMPLPQLLYAQVVKTVRRRRLVRLSHRVVFGTLAAVHDVLAPCGWQINTAFVERINLTIRQHVAAVGRRVSTLCKDEDGLRQQLALYHASIHLDLEMASWERDDGKIGKLCKTVQEFYTFIERNRAFIPNYGERYRNGERISTGFVESTVNQVVSKRMVKKQQMRWSQRGAHLLLQIRTRVLNGEWEDVFRRWYPGFRAQTQPVFA